MISSFIITITIIFATLIGGIIFLTRRIFLSKRAPKATSSQTVPGEILMASQLTSSLIVPEEDELSKKTKSLEEANLDIKNAQLILDNLKTNQSFIHHISLMVGDVIKAQKEKAMR